MHSESLRIVFMGTPDFAVESLRKLTESGINVVGVITAPDKPSGRGKKIQPPPVKVFAREAGIQNILQPEKLKAPEFLEELKALGADLQVVVAFRMLPEEVWAMPPKGTINLHASLLPDYRGAAPINWAIINGEKKTGVTTFFIEKDIDTGNIIFDEKVEIGPDITAGELHDTLMLTGADLLLKTVRAIAGGQYPTIPQSEINHGHVPRTAPKIFKEDCKIRWNQDTRVLHNFIRGLSPYPAAWTEIIHEENTIPLKIFRADYTIEIHHMPIGHVLTDGNTYLKVAVHDGYINILELQQAGKKRMRIEEFLHGFQGNLDYRIQLSQEY
jgi:methionyl-tRNA formyltransferase